MPMTLCGLFQLSKRQNKAKFAGKDVNSSGVVTIEAIPATPGGQDFTFTVPDGAKPGSSIRIRTPHDKVIEMVLPVECQPGESVTVATGRSSGKLKKLQGKVKIQYETAQASCSALQSRLAQELQLQRNMWEFDGELSNAQVLVFAASETGDTKQLAAALEEAGKLGIRLSPPLQKCCQKLNAAEDAKVIWRCLLDALMSENRTDILFWREEACSLSLEVPSGVLEALDELEDAQEPARGKSKDSNGSVRSVREIYEECRQRGLDTRGCNGREDLEALIRNAPAVDTSAVKGFVAQVPAAKAINTLKSCDAGTVWSRAEPLGNTVPERSKHLHLLGISQTAMRCVEQAELRAAYRKAAMECHPDRQQNRDREDEAKNLFQRVKTAFDYIKASS